MPTFNSVLFLHVSSHSKRMHLMAHSRVPLSPQKNPLCGCNLRPVVMLSSTLILCYAVTQIFTCQWEHPSQNKALLISYI